MNQRKMRPTRAERARQKTRVPNLPQDGPPLERHWEPVEPRRRHTPEPALAQAAAPATAPYVRAPRQQPGTITDYAYVKTDLIRIGVITFVLAAGMVGLALIQG